MTYMNETIDGCYNVNNEWFISTMEGNKYQLLFVDNWKHSKLERNVLDIHRGDYSWASEDFTRKWNIRFDIGHDGETYAVIASDLNATQIFVDVVQYYGDLPADYSFSYDRKMRSYTYIKDQNYVKPVKPQPKSKPMFTPRQMRIIDNAYSLSCNEIKQRCQSITTRMQIHVMCETSNSFELEELTAYQHVMNDKCKYA